MTAKDRMDTYRTNAIVVGVLFILAIVVLFAGEALYRPILDSPDYLENAFPNRAAVIIGILLEFVGVPSVVLLSVFLFPVLKKHNEPLALGYVSFRVFEAAVLSVSYVSKLSLVSLSQEYLNTGGADASFFQTVGSSIQSLNHWAGTQGLVYLIVFSLGSLMFNYILYQSRLVPRLISGWGVVAAVILLTGSVLINLDVFAGMSGLGLELIFAGPIPVGEIAVSVWLIAKGFNPSALAAEPA